MSSVQRTDRRHAAEGDEGQRTAFERDRDALFYTTAFRRLAGVTQVVSPTEGQVYHNRLTHTIEVAQIAQRLAERLHGSQGELAKEHAIDVSVVEAAALAHDLGHPPFGHVAEKELNVLVKQTVIDGYEGNAQSFRIITKLAVRTDQPGLNLTRACLDATLKYPRFQEETGDGSQLEKKWGAYQSERDDFEFARGLHEPEDRGQSAEAQLMDWADDIAYSVHDTEDFYRAGLVPLGQLSIDKSFALKFLEDVFARWEQKGIRTPYEQDELAREFLKVCGTMPFAGPYEPTREQRAQLRAFTSDFIGRYVMNTRLREEPNEDGALLEVDDEHRMQVEMLKELTWQFVIKGPSLISMQHGQRKVIQTLFEIFAEAVTSNDPHGKWAVLPARDRAEMESLRQEYGEAIPDSDRIRVAADAVAGMTDQQAVLMYQRLTGISCGSVLDAIVI